MSNNKMAEKPILPLILTMSFPTMISMVITALYNIIDSIYVARISSEALTAVSLAFPIQNLILAVALGIGIGVNSCISRKLGEDKLEEANIIATHGVFIAIISSILFIIFALSFSEMFLSMFTKSNEVITLGKDYLHILGLFSFGLIIHITIEKILQATGEMLLPMIFQTVGAVTNIILDPIFIFGMYGVPAFGVKGAGIATVTGQILALVLAIITLLVKKQGVKCKLIGFKYDKDIVKNIYAVAIPTTLIQSLGSILVICLNSLLISFSEIAVSFMGIYFKLQTFVFMPIEGLRQGILPIIGYNYGAKNKTRVLQTIKSSIIISLIFTISGTISFLLLPTQIISMFDSSVEMLEIGINGLRILCLCFIPATFGIVFITIFQSLGQGFYSLIICLSRQIIITIPLAYILSKFIGLNGVWITFVISETIGAGISIYLFNKVRAKDELLH